MSNKESQIRVLQQQINPHFLYNTLDSINWSARENGDTDVAEMITLLGRFFRSNMSRKGELTTLREEIENIRLYIGVSKIRFGDRLNCEIITEGVSDDTPVMKLLIQPLVENAIKHGIEEINLRENIEIFVGSEDSEIVLSVKDNGAGMDEEQVAYIRDIWDNMDENYHETKTVGLYNVMRRLYLSYPDESRFEIFSEKGKGTNIIITWPSEQENEKN